MQWPISEDLFWEFSKSTECLGLEFVLSVLCALPIAPVVKRDTCKNVVLLIYYYIVCLGVEQTVV